MKIEEFNNMLGKEVLSKHSMSYILMLLEGDYALIEVIATPNITRGYEVWKLREQAKGSISEGHLRFPSDEDFGRYGWFYSTREEVMSKFKELMNNEVKYNGV